MRLNDEGPCHGLAMLLPMVLGIIVAVKSDSTYVDVGVYLTAFYAVRVGMRDRR